MDAFLYEFGNEHMKGFSSEGRYALGGLSLLAIWLFVVLPALNASTLTMVVQSSGRPSLVIA